MNGICFLKGLDRPDFCAETCHLFFILLNLNLFRLLSKTGSVQEWIPLFWFSCLLHLASVASRAKGKTLVWQLVEGNTLVATVLISAQEVKALQSWCWHHSKHTKSWRQWHSLLQGVYLHLIRLAKRVLREQYTKKETVHASHSPWHQSQSWKDWNMLIRLL